MHYRALSLSLLSISLAVVVVVSCVGNSSAPEETSSTAQDLAVCADNCDCGYGRFCNNGACEIDFGPFYECYCAARDCDPGLSCINGFCTNASPCMSNCDCGYGRFCNNGACEIDFGPFYECYCAARDCGPGQACVNGHCSGS